MSGIRIARKIISTLVKDRIHYPARLIIDTFAVIARCGLLLILYAHVFRINGGVINGTTFIFAAWSIFFYFSFSILRLRDISRAIMQDVQSGTIEMLLSKPFSYLWYRACWQIGSGIYSFITIFVVATIILGFWIGFPSTMLVGVFIPTFTLTFLCGSVLSLLVYSAVGLLAFWMEDVNPVFWVVDKAVMILGGSYLPVALFPPLMFKLALYSPFGATLFVSHTVSPSWQTTWTTLVGAQLFWIAIFGLVVYCMFERARRKVSINGG